MIERPRASDTLSLLLGIVRNPAIHSMKLEPEDDSIATEYLRNSPSFHSIEVIYRLHGRPESLTIPTCNIWNFGDCESPKESLDTLHIEVDIRAVRFIEITEHLGSDPGIGYPNRYRNADIVIYLFFQRLCEIIISPRDIREFCEELINREYFYLPELCCEILHESLRYLPIPRVVRDTFHELLPEHPLGFPEWCSRLHSIFLRLIACGDDYLISYTDTFPLEQWVPEDFTRSIKTIAVDMCKDASRCMEYHN